MAVELVKENIECEQLLCESSIDTVVKAEYIIPDTHPDVFEILTAEGKPTIITKEVMKDKAYLEGQIEYNVLYLAKEEDGKCGLYNVVYSGKFSDYVELQGSETGMTCDAQPYVEDLECNIANERKILVNGIIKLKCSVYKKNNIQVVKDISNTSDIQLLKNPVSIDKILGTGSLDLVAKSHILIDSDKPPIGNVLRCDVNVHKKDVKILENKISIEAFALIQIVYRAKDSRDIYYIKDDVLINNDTDMQGVVPTMDSRTDFKLDAVQYDVKEDETGENRIIDVEALIKAQTKVMYKEDIEFIQDAYSPTEIMDMKKNSYKLTSSLGSVNDQVIVKGNVDAAKITIKPVQIISTFGSVCITDKKLVEDKVIIEGLLNTEVLYKTADEDKYVNIVKEDIPFTSSMDMSGCKIDMSLIAAASLESIEASIESNSIVVRGNVLVWANVSYLEDREFLVDIQEDADKKPEKKASITIYIVQPGDTLWKIAKNYYTTMDTIVKVNEIENPDELKTGDKLLIPGKAIL